MGAYGSSSWFVALLSAMVAMAIDMLLPAFEQMRAAFGLAEDSTSLALTMTLFFMGVAVGTLFYGPISDSAGPQTGPAGQHDPSMP